jgi:putative ABC transport system permease protein
MRRLVTKFLRLLLGPLGDEIAGDANEARWSTARLAAIGIGTAIRRARVPRFTGATGAAADARQALRGLIRTPASTIVVILTLAAGLGINSAIFSVVYGVLFQPLPFRDPGRVVMIQGIRGASTSPPSIYSTSEADFRDFERGNRTFESLGLGGYWTFTLTNVATPQRMLGMAVTGRFFETLGTPPLLGRWLTMNDDRADAEGGRKAVISHLLWQREFAGRADAIGKTMMLNGQKTTVVGVMPASFRFPSPDVELWSPVANEMNDTPRNVRFLSAVGRLRTGITIEQASADLNAIAAALAVQFPDTNRDWSVAVVPAIRALTSTAREQLLLLFAAVIVVLLVAAVNVAGLMASRRSAREREFALRTALGAGRLRLARLSIFESGWLGIAGLALGLLAAGPCLTLLRGAAPTSLPRIDDVSLNLQVVAASTLAMIVITAACGLAPLWNRRLVRLAGDLASARTTSSSGRRAFGRAGLVVTQVALAFVLLAGAGLLARSFSRVLAVDPGFDADRLMTMRVFLGPPKYRGIPEQVQYTGRALDQLRAVPGVTMATVVSQPPFDRQGGGTSLPTAVEGRTYAPGEIPNASYRVVAPGYFAAMKLPIREGRELSSTDGAGTEPVVVINATMARQFWPGESAIGKKVRWPQAGNAPALTVVGVAGNVATDGLEKQERPALYGPYAQRTLPYLRWLTFVVRTDGDPGARANELRAAMQAADPDQPVFGVETMDAIIGKSLAERRFALLLMLSFAALTLLVAMLGLYGALAQTVHQRRREIGVRLAIGSSPTQVFRAIAGDGLRLVIIGLAIGGAASAAASRSIEKLLFGVTPSDPWTYGLISLVLFAVAAVACAIPALRASRVDPVQALRAD